MPTTSAFESSSRRPLLAALLSALAVNAAAAESAVDANEGPFSGTLSLLSDYRFRGISQNYGGPGLIADLTWTFPGGLYVGTWLANVSRNQFQNGRDLETDVYLGYKTRPWQDTEIDLGLFQWFFPRSRYYAATRPVAIPGDTDYSTLEAYAGISRKGLTVRYSRTLSDWFGVHTPTYGGSCGIDARGVATQDCFPANPGSSRGSGYLEFDASFPLGEATSLNLHLGHQWVRNFRRLDYSDYKIGVTRDFGWASLGLALVGTNANPEFYRSAPLPTLQGTGTETRRLGGRTLMLSAVKSF